MVRRGCECGMPRGECRWHKRGFEAANGPGSRHWITKVPTAGFKQLASRAALPEVAGNATLGDGRVVAGSPVLAIANVHPKP
jgi:hypothetical protein